MDARTGLPGLEGQAYSTTTHASKATAQAGDGDAAKVESLVAQSHKPKLDRCWKDSNVQVRDAPRPLPPSTGDSRRPCACLVVQEGNGSRHWTFAIYDTFERVRRLEVDTAMG